jgi:hypothetical protein
MMLRSLAGLWIGMTLAAGAALAQSATLHNPTRRTYENELVRLKAEAPAIPFAVKSDDREVPYQIGEVEGRKHVWVCVTMEGGSSRTFRLLRREDRPTFEPMVSVRKDGGTYVMDNGLIGVKVPVAAGDGLPGPVLAVKLPGGRWVGKSFWKTDRKLKRFTAAVLGDGTLFGKVRLRYEFEGKAGLDGDVDAFAEIDVRLAPAHRHVRIEERHEMAPGDFWEFDAAAGWKPRQAMCEIHGSGIGRVGRGDWPKTLEVGQTRMHDTLLNLMPRWTQAFDEGWFFAATDGSDAVGALVARAGKWVWPHNNLIEVKVRKSGDYAGLRCPTWKGRRYWMLLAGPKETWHTRHVPHKDPKKPPRRVSSAKDYVRRHGFEPLDKLNHDYILVWPGRNGGFSGDDFYSSGMNPSGWRRGLAKGAMKNVGRSGNVGTLTKVQVWLDPDCYGTYWNFWSPENPNFFTDFMKGPIAMGTQLKDHPRFKEIARMVERKFREDVYHSVTLPGGAGNECPGYEHYAMGSWKELAPICRKYYGFDPTTWPRYKAGGSFLARSSFPDWPKRVFHPGGDTHPNRPDPLAVARQFGCQADPRSWTTEELPGFGVIFRNRCGTQKETYLAFKSGPSRGHYHGDQLSFHFCSNARPVAVDHHCSYHPRAGQEHMHNRVAFSSGRFPYANMDGFERVIAFRTGRDADAAIGQVESHRIREVNKLPPEDWDKDLPQTRFETALTYRRTIVQVKNAGRDYFVIRDQYAGPKLTATYCLHVYGDTCRRSGQTVRFDDLTLFVARPQEFAFENMPWSHTNGGPESTQGPRLSVAGGRVQFITVLYPGGEPAKMVATPAGVKVGDDEIVFGGDDIDDREETNYVTVRRAGKTVLTLTGGDIDMNRSQGEVGLFVPDAGYPFGRIPDWLIRQRAKRPDWAKGIP